MYKLTEDSNTIIRLSDGASIPKGHRWYQDYLDWEAEGNEPEAQFTQEELDQQAISTTNQESLAYLVSTDWYVVRSAETGLPVPQDILDARANARLATQ